LVLAPAALPELFVEVDLRGAAAPWDDAQARLRGQANQVFDLATAPPLQLELLRLGEQEAILALNLHHIVSDGWSAPLLRRELLARYQAGRRGEEVSLPALSLQYKDYAHWQHKRLAGEAATAHRAYWNQRLGGELPTLQLPEDFPRPAVKTFNGAYFQYVVSTALADRLAAVAQAHQASPFMLLLAALKTLFFRYTGVADVIIGTPVAGREREELSHQLGLYVNTLALRTEFEADCTFAELLDKERELVLEAFEHQYYPFDLVVSGLKAHFDPSRSALFDVMLVYQNDGEQAADADLTLGELAVEELTEEFNGSKMDLGLVARRVSEGLQFHVEYNTDIYAEVTVRRLLDHFAQLLESIAAAPDTPLTRLDYLGAEQQVVVRDFNPTAPAAPALHSVQAHFEHQVARNPVQPALIFPGGQLSYRELNDQANQLAAWLRAEHQVGPDCLVAFVLERSEWPIITMLAILKAGGAFLPIDPSYPAERMRFILEDACPVVTLVSQPLPFQPAGPVQELPALLLQLAGYPTENLPDTTRPEDLAYVIYTSGSTGKPKGVLLEHRGNINMITDQVRRFAVGPADRCLQFASISFDGSVYEIFLALYAGASLVLLTPELLANPARCQAYLLEQRVTVAVLPPAYLATLDREQLGSLRMLLTAGEAPNPADALYLSQRLAYYNGYGPTEYSVCATVYRVTGHETTIPIGQPIANTQLLILDAHGQPLPVGFWGELYLSGAGCARGYLNRPELTARHFRPNPFSPGQTMYRTGDMARWLPDGNVEFRGRLDSQVKIRGYRVELGEIELALLEHPAVHQAAVTYAKGPAGTDQLRAYVVGEPTLQWTELKGFLTSRLPQFMVPTHYCPLAELPVTVNGKIDLRALPQPAAEPQHQADAPANETERMLAGLWQQVLQLPTVGVTDSFYDLGGQSILAMRLIGRLWQTFGVNVSLRDLMRHVTIREQAAGLLGGGSREKGLLLPLSRPQPGQPVLFLLPPVVGTASVFQPLGRALG
ncbi:MAG: amino acid adenylation domain-containing protein, partial [Bacteroidota bacterium]|nr:amino acid adenylation domain-containing protein [Bacteroidota bacterium]